MESIFNPFFTTKTEGTGLGLSWVHRLLESYDGFLQVESQPGRGRPGDTDPECHRSSGKAARA
jgi:nitrogen-specific signal transduction histidine kinase